VVALLDEARKNQAAGQFDMAAANLQRALRIEPRNYFLWSALASVYLDQHQYDQAQTIALKSNSLAHGNLYVELKNWQTIAAARQANGDSAGALQAHGKIDEIQRQLPSG
jgi:tetratricopeptide (TPR) repeat protein